MPTGACGINCDVCDLKVKGICGGCDAGTRRAGDTATPCPVLQCAARKGVGHCMRDCGTFPCGIMQESAFPFSAAYLRMHRQRKG